MAFTIRAVAPNVPEHGPMPGRRHCL